MIIKEAVEKIRVGEKHRTHLGPLHNGYFRPAEPGRIQLPVESRQRAPLYCPRSGWHAFAYRCIYLTGGFCRAVADQNNRAADYRSDCCHNGGLLIIKAAYELTRKALCPCWILPWKNSICRLYSMCWRSISTAMWSTDDLRTRRSGREAHIEPAFGHRPADQRAGGS